MTIQQHSYGRIPDFFEQTCHELGLPLKNVTEDTKGFIAAVLALPDSVHQVRMRLYLESRNGGYNYLRCYLHASGVPLEDSGRVANTVLAGLKEAGIPDRYRDVRR